MFNKSLLTCHGLITGGGFETPSEALYLGKRLMSIPIKDHYEQQCNAAAMKKMGVTVLEEIDNNFENHVEKWYLQKPIHTEVKANKINETLTYLFDTYPHKKEIPNEETTLFI
jgi:uncharacterized protein (TIGR00661 family)